MNRRTLLALACLLFLPVSVPAAQDKSAAQPTPKGQRVFVCGHSFHVMIVTPLTDIAKKAGIQDHEHVGTQFLGGSRTLQHWELPDEKNQAKKAIRSGKLDVLTLSPHLKLPDEGIDHFTELLLEHNPDARVLVQASWYPFDGIKVDGKNLKNAARDEVKVEELRKIGEPVFQQLVAQVEKLNARYKDKNKRQVVFLVPVGQAVLALREQVVAGKVPGIAKQSELFLDDIGHAKPPVAVLAAYCHYAVIYRRSPVGLPLPGALKDDKLNRLLQEIAWETVTAHTALTGVGKN
jgi:hypothetical protein